jgi:hypothetical protein
MSKATFTFSAAELKTIKQAAEAYVVASTKRDGIIIKMFGLLGHVLTPGTPVEIDGPKWEALQTAYAEYTVPATGNTVDNEKRMFSRTAAKLGFIKLLSPEVKAARAAKQAERENDKATGKAKKVSAADKLTEALKAVRNAATGKGSETERFAEIVRIVNLALGDVPAIVAPKAA